MRIPALLLLALVSAACSCGTGAPAVSGPTPVPDDEPRALPSESDPPDEPGSSASPETSVPETASLSFSAEQADAGRRIFRASCTDCHSSSEFSDRSFKFKWRRRTAGDLFGLMYATMPEDAPGSLAAADYGALVAYILRLNGLKAGEGELPGDEEALKQLSLARIADPGQPPPAGLGMVP